MQHIYFYLFILFLSYCFAQNDSINFFPADTGTVLKIRKTDLTSSLSQINDTTGYLSKHISFNKDNYYNGKRPEDSIKKYILQKLPIFRYEYNQRLKEIDGEKRSIFKKKQYLKGKITFQFLILSDGSVSDCNIKESTINDSLFEIRLLLKLYKLNFGPIENKNDTTMVTYPFIFSE